MVKTIQEFLSIIESFPTPIIRRITHFSKAIVAGMVNDFRYTVRAYFSPLRAVVRIYKCVEKTFWF